VTVFVYMPRDGSAPSLLGQVQQPHNPAVTAVLLRVTDSLPTAKRWERDLRAGKLPAVAAVQPVPDLTDTRTPEQRAKALGLDLVHEAYSGL
jgi:hypothetical protein